MTVYKLKNLGYAWIDNATINDIDCIEITDEEVMIFRDGKEVANAIISYVDEVGYHEYDENGYTNNDTGGIIYEYE